MEYQYLYNAINLLYEHNVHKSVLLFVRISKNLNIFH